jgi:hypothetical protein
VIERYSREEVQTQFTDGLSGLGISLKPPKWLRKVASQLQNKLPKGTTVNVDLGTGAPISVDLSDPTSVAALRKQFENAKLSLTRKSEPSVTEPLSSNSTMLIAVGAVALVAMMMMGKKR